MTMKWFADKQKLAGDVMKSYESVRGIRCGGAAWAVAAAAGVGQTSQNLSDFLFAAGIPKDVRTGPYAEDGVIAYCDALTEKAEPLGKLSVDACSFCLNLSTNLNWFNDWSRYVRARLGKFDRRRFQRQPSIMVSQTPPTTLSTPKNELPRSQDRREQGQRSRRAVEKPAE